MVVFIWRGRRVLWRKRNEQRLSSSDVTAGLRYLSVCDNHLIVCPPNDEECKPRARIDTLADSDFLSFSADRRLGRAIALRPPSALKLGSLG